MIFRASVMRIFVYSELTSRLTKRAPGGRGGRLVIFLIISVECRT